MLRLGLASLRPAASSSARLATRNFSTFRPTTTTTTTIFQTLKQSRTFTNSAFKSARFNGGRTTASPIIEQAQPFPWRRVALIAGGVAGTVIAIEAVFNRETRASLSTAERSLLNESFAYTGAGIAITAGAARALFRSGFVYRLMSANPWVVVGASLIGGIGSIAGVYYTPPESTLTKHAFWLTFNAFQAATLCPLFFYSPALLARAGLYTLGVVGSLSYVGATAANDQYLMMGGPLLAGVTVVALSGLAPLVIPATATRALALTENLWLYGGLAVFGGFVLYDTQKILMHARMAEQGLMKRDPMRESIGLQLDMVNIFVRIVQILAMQQRKK
ncbi:Bax Inhibitor family protein [Mycena kentingensis (nom. inval.)]|nr:Bax Inhibitor family protein [Mycena kentingensis (nom. inval.)]